MTPQSALHSYEQTLEKAKQNGDQSIVKDLTFRINLMKRFPQMNIQMDQLTVCSTHGDYFISQIICGKDKINTVIDWTTACIHPVVWEIMRSFTYADPECAQGSIDAKRLAAYVLNYLEYAPLTEYDISMLVKVFYYQIAVCDYYGQFYHSNAANRMIYLDQAVLATKLLRFLDCHYEKLTEELTHRIVLT